MWYTNPTSKVHEARQKAGKKTEFRRLVDMITQHIEKINRHPLQIGKLAIYPRADLLTAWLT